MKQLYYIGTQIINKINNNINIDTITLDNDGPEAEYGADYQEELETYIYNIKKENRNMLLLLIAILLTLMQFVFFFFF